MALRIELVGDKPGIAKLIIQKWLGGSDVDILIQRNQDGHYLADNSQWVAETCWHNITNLTLDNGKLEGVVTNWLVDALLSQENHIRFLVTIRDHQDDNQPDQAIYSDRGAINIAENVLSSSALDSASRTDTVNSLPDMPDNQVEEPIAPQVEESNVVETTIAEAVPKKSKKKWALLLFTLLLLIIAGLAWYFFTHFMSAPVAAPAPTSELVSECQVTAAGDDDLLFIKKCLQTRPDSQSILQLINNAKAAGKCNIAQRLYANQSQKSGDIALMYAKEYDAEFYQPNSCFQADAETAIYWYETAQSLDPKKESSLIQSRIDALKK
ncbi:hypothetical protein PT276_07485 [Orbaceae bacterium ESL0721]|nr:hypothetical protein [Orbaceae bacterium ESL0721]